MTTTAEQHLSAEERRQSTIRRAIEAADRILCDEAEVGELEVLTLEVARHFVDKVTMARRGSLLTRELVR